MKNWHASGSYYESCNCEAICPCRPQGDRPGGRSTYGVCDFVLSWLIQDGQVDGVDVSDRTVVLAGSYDDDEPGQPWRIVLYVDDRCAPAQHEALTPSTSSGCRSHRRSRRSAGSGRQRSRSTTPRTPSGSTSIAT